MTEYSIPSESGDLRVPEPPRFPGGSLGLYSVSPDASELKPEEYSKALDELGLHLGVMAKKIENLRGSLPDRIIRILKDPNVGDYVKATAIKQIAVVAEDQRAGIIEAVLKDSNVGDYVKAHAIYQIAAVAEDQQVELRELAGDIIRAILKDPNVGDYDKANAIKQIAVVAEDQRAGIIEAVLRGPHVQYDLMIAAIKQIAAVAEDQQVELRELAGKLGFNIGDLMLSNPLNNNAGYNGVKEFEKTGSELFTVNKGDRVDTVVRIIDFSCFDQWLNAFLAAATWRAAGFDYIPIEPILDFSYSEDINSNIKVAITTINLRGGSLEKTIGLYNSTIQTKIEEAKTIIIETMRVLNINHGHHHDNNFVLVPRKDSRGNPDPEAMPRIYLIDFDAAARLT